MDVLKIFFLVMLWQVEIVGSQKLLSERANSLRSIEKLIVYIKLGNDEVCAGVQISDAWILTLADCVDTNIKLGKYRIIYQDGSKQIIAEDRDSVGEEFVLLRMKTTKETKTKFAKLSDSMSPSPDYDYQLYSKDESDEVTAHDVVFVKGIQCVKKGIEGNFGVTHKCFRVNMGKTTKCLPGNPIFGSKENKIMLQGLTVATSDSCSSSLYSYASIKPQVSWINTIILDCGSVENIQNGKISLDKKSKTSVGATATIECDNGYLASRQKITCLNTGKWQKSICTIKDCGPVKKMPRGRVVLDKAKTTTYGATATIKCSSGYTANQETIVCLDTGKWEAARCRIKNCGPVIKILNGRVTLDKVKTSKVGATATIKCKLGYKANQKKIVCLDTGKWEAAKCKIKDCGSPSNVSNGNLQYTTTTFGSTASLVCDIGYAGNGTISCLDTGSWETPPSCSIRDCGSPSNVSNGNLHYTSTTFGSTASLVCDRGYAGNGTISCLDTGSWETPPSCSIKGCGSPLNVTNGYLNYTTTTIGSTASLVCDKGFGYDGNGTISCLDPGSWETPPKCSLTECPEGWTEFEKSCYLFVKTYVTWETAKNDCGSKNGYLVEIHSASESTFLRDTISDAYVWLGLTDKQTEGEFVWEYSGATFNLSIVGESLYYNHPNNDCAYYMYYSTYNQWRVENCENTKTYMCEISL